ncbi:MAG TPA: N-acetyltransferase, partial [Actinophytocola sp.]|nr:N-acetyltransferase [Actinophytocola sp.]
MSELFRLRPVIEEDLEHLEQMVSDPVAIGEFSWDGFHDPRFWRRRWEENRLLGGERWTLIAESPDGDRIGFITWRPVHPDSPYECWE